METDIDRGDQHSDPAQDQGTVIAQVRKDRGGRIHYPSSTQPSQAPTFRRMVWDMEALAWMMMVAVLSSRISLRSGVGSRVSSSIRTESVSLEIRNCRSSFSRFKRPGGRREEEAPESVQSHFHRCSGENRGTECLRLEAAQSQC